MITAKVGFLMKKIIQRDSRPPQTGGRLLAFSCSQIGIITTIELYHIARAGTKAEHSVRVKRQPPIVVWTHMNWP